MAVLGNAGLMGLGLLCLGLGLIAGWALTRIPRISPGAPVPAPARTILLFEGETLIDATGPGLAALGVVDGVEVTLGCVKRALASLFVDMSPDCDLTGRVWDCAAYPDLTLTATEQAGTLRIVLTDASDPGPGSWISERHSQQVQVLTALQKGATPMMWMTKEKGGIIWSNAAFDAEPDFLTGIDALPKDADDDTAHRINKAGRWFDVSQHTTAIGTLHIAADADAMVKIDSDRKMFVQTLGKTFAQLSTGLAIFDEARQLVMFNPALHEMTNLPIDFLTSRPSVDRVLDRLREHRFLPEPKDYTSWKETFTSVEDGAKSGKYREIWSLPDGQTYRVTGKPHPNGAFALLFEDISAEISLTRRFRTDIETNQMVMDLLPDAIAVFSAMGTLVMNNKPYSTIWDTEPELMFNQRDWTTEISAWKARSKDEDHWDDMLAYLQQVGVRDPWSSDVVMLDGRRLHCAAHPIKGGMTVVRFSARPLRAPMHLVEPAPVKSASHATRG